MDWGSVIANAVGGAATGLVSMADSAQKDDQRRELETLKGQLQMDRLQASIDGKFQALMAGIEGKLAVQEARNSQGGRSNRALGLHEMTPEQEAAASRLYGSDGTPTDRNRFVTATKNGDPATTGETQAGTDELRESGGASGGPVGDALSRKMTGLASEAFDGRGYSDAEEKRTKKNMKVNTLLTNPAALDNLSKSEKDDFLLDLTERVLKKPNVDVGKVADIISLLKPGDARMTMGSDKTIFNTTTGEVTRAGDDGASSTREASTFVDSLRKNVKDEINEMENARDAELKNASSSSQDAIIKKYEARFAELKTKRDNLDALYRQIQERLGLTKPAGAAAKPSTTTKLPSPKDLADQFKAKRNATN